MENQCLKIVILLWNWKVSFALFACFLIFDPKGKQLVIKSKSTRMTLDFWDWKQNQKH